MKKIFGLLISLLLLSGCAESLALLGPASTSVTGGNLAQSAFSSATSYSIKKQTGKSPLEHAKAYADKKNLDKKQILLTSTELTKKSPEIMQKFPEINAIKETSLIEKIARKSVIYNRR